jgi:hypothetical protein
MKLGSTLHVPHEALSPASPASPLAQQHCPTHLHQIAALLVRRQGLLQLLVGLRRCHTKILQLLPALLLSAAALLPLPLPLPLPQLRPAKRLRQQRLPLQLQVLKPPLLLHHRRRCLDKHGRQVLPHCTQTNNLRQQC